MAEHETSPENRKTVTAETDELRLRLAAAESQLRDQAAELDRLRDDIQQVRALVPPVEEPAPAAARRPARQVEIVRLDALPPRESWLHRCEGFTVELPDGTVGTVEEARYGSRYDRPDRLAVRVGRWRSRLVLVPVDEVEDIDPAEELVLLRGEPDRGHSDSFERPQPLAGLLESLTRSIRARTGRSSPS